MKVSWFCEHCGVEFSSSKACGEHEKACPKRPPAPVKRKIYNVSLDERFGDSVHIVDSGMEVDMWKPCIEGDIVRHKGGYEWYIRAFKEDLTTAVDKVVAKVVRELKDEAGIVNGRLLMIGQMHQDALDRAKEIMGDDGSNKEHRK